MRKKNDYTIRVNFEEVGGVKNPTLKNPRSKAFTPSCVEDFLSRHARKAPDLAKNNKGTRKVGYTFSSKKKAQQVFSLMAKYLRETPKIQGYDLYLGVENNGKPVDVIQNFTVTNVGGRRVKRIKNGKI